MRLLLRTKLIASLVLVVLISGVISMIVGVRLIADDIVKQAQAKVELDLNSAREVYNEESQSIKTKIRLTANRFFIKEAITDKDIPRLKKELPKIRTDESLDILNLADRSGKVLVRARSLANDGDRPDDQIIDWVLLHRQAIVATQIISEDDLIKEGGGLVEQARIEIVPTPKAKPRTERLETSGMMIKAAAPIFDGRGNLVGILYGGKLLNRDYTIVDKVKDIVYKGEKYRGKDIGTVTIFQGDLRISTNVMKDDGIRAIGTRVSQEVYDRVIGRGLPWIGRAFVVNDWYITAYEPIRDINEKIVGILYVGILEEKFTDLRNNVVSTFMIITILGIVLAFGLSLILANSIVRPVRRLAQVSRHIAEGDFSYKVDIRSNDEIGEFGRTFNFMVQSIQDRDNRIREFAQTKIAEAERLALIGQLAAGVAHEINNPLTGIILYCDLLLKGMAEDDPRRANLEKINHEALRCKTIVKGLLDFARQKKPEIKESSINGLLDSTIALLKNQALFLNITIKKDYLPSLPLVKIDPQQIQQVFMNIIINAAEAMEGRGDLRIETRMADDKKSLEVRFLDNGPGIHSDHMKKIFEPFFTTKEATHGVGLGLAISYRIIEDHGGAIRAESELGKGTIFTIVLPCR